MYQGYTSRFPRYISKATMLLISESGASKKKDEKGENFILNLSSRGEEDRFDYTKQLYTIHFDYTIHTPKNVRSWMHRVSKQYKCSTSFVIELPQYLRRNIQNDHARTELTAVRCVEGRTT
jgi:hypothetical protein